MQDAQVVFQFGLQLLSVQIVCCSCGGPNMSGLCRGCHSRCGSRRASTNCLKVLDRQFLECESALSWQSAKTPGGGSGGVFVPDHPHCQHCTCCLQPLDSRWLVGVSHLPPCWATSNSWSVKESRNPRTNGESSCRMRRRSRREIDRAAREDV